MRALRFAVLAAVLFAFASPALAKGAKVDICHWDEDAGIFFVINVSENAVAKHFDNHGDVYPGDWWYDADGDGYGDPAGATDVCPNAGFVDNDLDCNDGDAAVNPGVDEVCGDDIDNNCDGQVDENCLTCPCFTYEEINVAYDEWLGQDNYYSGSHWRRCYDRDTIYPNYYADNTYVQFYTYGSAYPLREYDQEYFYTWGYNENLGSHYCRHYTYEYTYNYQTGQYDEYTYELPLQTISWEEKNECQALVIGWAEDHGMVCNAQMYYQ